MTSGRGAVIAIHAGAAPATSVVVEQEARCRAALHEALAAGRDTIEAGGDAVAAVRAAVMVMEDFELFNAGRGAVLRPAVTEERPSSALPAGLAPA